VADWLELPDSWSENVCRHLVETLGLHEIEITCRHGSAGPDPLPPTLVEILTEDGWSTKLNRSTSVIEDDAYERSDSTELFLLSREPGTDTNRFRLRFRFVCPTCCADVPARAENLDQVTARLAEHQITSIDLAQLHNLLARLDSRGLE
jgi:hypothetical protein